MPHDSPNRPGVRVGRTRRWLTFVCILLGAFGSTLSSGQSNSKNVLVLFNYFGRPPTLTQTLGERRRDLGLSP